MRILFLFMLLFGFVVHAEVVDRIIAKVGSDVITQSDLRQAVREQKAILIQRLGKDKGIKAWQDYKDNALEELILQKIFKSQIKEEGIQVTDDEVEQEYQNRMRQYGMNERTLIERLSQEGLTLAQFKKAIRTDLEQQRFVQKKIMPNVVISDYDLQQEYQKNIRDYQVYGKVRFVEVFLTPDKFSDPDEMSRIAKQIQVRLQRGQSVAALVKKYSSGAFAEKGGDSGLVDASQLRAEIQTILSQLKVGQTSQIFPIQNGVFIFKLLAKSDPKPLPFAKVINQVRNRYGEKVVQDELRKYLMAVRDQTYVEILR